MDTAKATAGPAAQNKKGRVFTRPAGTFRTREVSALRYCFGVSLDFGAAGFGVVLVGFGAAGFAAGAAGAGTPDCTLYASTIGLVMSTESWFHHKTGLCGHGFDVSTIMPYPFSCEYFTIIGAIFCKMRLAMSCCWLPNSSWASCTLRSNSFCLPSICFLRVSRAS